MRRTYPNSTALPASIRTVQWSCPSGTLLQVIAMRWAACPSASAWRRRSCRLSVSTASTPPARKRWRMLRIVCSEMSSTSAISASVQPSSLFNNTLARVSVRALALPRRTNTCTWARSSSLRCIGAGRPMRSSPVFPQHTINIKLACLLAGLRGNNALAARIGAQAELLLPQIASFGALTIIGRTTDTIECSIRDTDTLEFLKGDWLEVYVWKEAINAGFADDCQWGYKIVAELPLNELDMA